MAMIRVELQGDGNDALLPGDAGPAGWALLI